MINTIEDEISNIIENGRIIKIDPVIHVLNIARLKEIYEEKNKGKMRKEMIPINKQIALDLNISVRQVVRLSFFNKLIPKLKIAFCERKFNISIGIKCAELSDIEQEIIWLLIECGCKINKDVIEKLQIVFDSNMGKTN